MSLITTADILGFMESADKTEMRAALDLSLVNPTTIKNASGETILNFASGQLSLFTGGSRNGYIYYNGTAIDFSAESADLTIGCNTALSPLIYFDRTLGTITSRIGGTDIMTVSASGQIEIFGDVIAENIPNFIGGSGTFAYGLIAPGGFEDQTITVTGAQIGDTVCLGLPASPNPAINFITFVSAADQVTVRAQNIGVIGITPSSETYNVRVLNFP